MVNCEKCGLRFRPENSSHIYHSEKCRREAASTAFDARNKGLLEKATLHEISLNASQTPAEALATILTQHENAVGYRLGGRTQKILRRGYEPRLRWFPPRSNWSLDTHPDVPEEGQYLLALFDSKKELLSLPKILVFVVGGSTRVKWSSGSETYVIPLLER